MKLTIDGTAAEIAEIMKKLTSAGNTDLMTGAIAAEKIADKIADKVNTPLTSIGTNIGQAQPSWVHTTLSSAELADILKR